MRPASPFLAILLLAAGAAIAGRAEARIEIDHGLEPEVIGIDETASFWIEVSATSGSPRFTPDFELDNLEALGPPGRSESFRFVNGATSRSFRLTWRLRPLAVGPAGIRDIRVRLGDEELQLPGRRIEIREEPPAGRRPADPGLQRRDPFDLLGPFRTPRDRRSQAAEPEVFLAAEARPARPYVGQQVVYTLSLYTQTQISSVQPRELPEFPGFWAHEVAIDSYEPEGVTIGGRRYGRVTLLKRVLFPRREGSFTIPPAEYDLVAQISSGGFFRPIRNRPVQLTRRTEPLELEVRPLPSGPPGFTGAVGRLAIEGKLSPAEIAVGEATTLTLRLTGDGHVQSLPAPRIPTPEGLTVFPPEEANAQELDGGRVRGERTWSFVLVPQEVGTWRLPPVEIPFYDPGVEAYRVAVSPAFELTAREAEAVAAEDAPADLHPIRSAAVPVEKTPDWRRLAPWLFAVPFALTLALRLRRRRAAKSGSPAARRLSTVIDEISEADSPRRVAARIEDAWRAFLAERWGIPEELPPARWAAHLQDSGVRTDDLAAVERLAADLHYLRFAPQLSTSASLTQELADHSRRLVRRLS